MLKKYIKHIITVIILIVIIYGVKILSNYYLGFNINEPVYTTELKKIVQQASVYAEKHYNSYGKNCEIGTILYMKYKEEMLICYQDVKKVQNNKKKDVSNYMCSISVNLKEKNIKKLSVHIGENYRQNSNVDVNAYAADFDDVYKLLEDIGIDKEDISTISFNGNLATVVHNHKSVRIDMINKKISDKPNSL